MKLVIARQQQRMFECLINNWRLSYPHHIEEHSHSHIHILLVVATCITLTDILVVKSSQDTNAVNACVGMFINAGGYQIVKIHDLYIKLITKLLTCDAPNTRSLTSCTRCTCTMGSSLENTVSWFSQSVRGLLHMNFHHRGYAYRVTST